MNDKTTVKPAKKPSKTGGTPPPGTPYVGTDEMRAKLDQAMIYAPGKWRSHLLRVTEAYGDAYTSHTTILNKIERTKNTAQSFWQYLIPIVLPALMGGFLGAVFAGAAKASIDKMTGTVAKALATVGADTTKTIISDVGKQETRDVYRVLTQTSGWKPAAPDPVKVGVQIERSVDDYVTIAADALNNSKTKGTADDYRKTVLALYYSPFVWEAPEEKDWWKPAELAVPLEIFLWAAWSKARDKGWWVSQINRVQSQYSFPSGGERGDYLDSLEALTDLKPILDRMIEFKVPESYLTQSSVPLPNDIRAQAPVPPMQSVRFLNPLWILWLGRKYPNTLLGELIQQLTDDKPQSFSLSRRPNTYKLM